MALTTKMDGIHKYERYERINEKLVMGKDKKRKGTKLPQIEKVEDSKVKFSKILFIIQPSFVYRTCFKDLTD